MSRIKLTVVAAVVAAFALSAVASASAHEYLSGGKPVSGNLKTHEFAGSFVLNGKPFLVAVHITCTKVHESGSITAPNTGEAQLEFKSCAATKPANCSVSEPIVTSVKTELVGAGAVENEFRPKTGTTFTTITLTGASCALKNEPFEVTGTQNCTLPGAGTEAVGHELKCLTSGSNLTAGGAKATFEGTIEGLELESGALWSAV